MSTAFVVWVYGAITIASLMAVVIWSVLITTRPFAENFEGFRHDTYWWLAFANVCGCLGTMGLSGSRTYVVMARGEAPSFSDPVVAALCLMLLLISRGSMVWASSLNHHPWRWRGFIGVMLAWTIIVALIGR